MLGDKVSRRFGTKMMVGYVPDCFGHISQLPQILRGFGLDAAVLWRGVGEAPSEFIWAGPDGSEVRKLFTLSTDYDGRWERAQIAWGP